MALAFLFLVIARASADGPTVPGFVPNSHFQITGYSASKKWEFCWKTIEIGSWFSSGRRHATIRVDSVTADQSPGVSLALGVLYGEVEGQVNQESISIESCGSSYHWSVKYGHGHGVEYVGNKWGDETLANFHSVCRCLKLLFD